MDVIKETSALPSIHLCPQIVKDSHSYQNSPSSAKKGKLYYTSEVTMTKGSFWAHFINIS